MDGLEFYRCVSCNNVVSRWDINKLHGCPVCEANKMRKSALSFTEKIVQIFRHPKVWRWNDDKYLRT